MSAIDFFEWGGVELFGVTKCFGFMIVVDYVDLVVCFGEFLLLLGLSGCGKMMMLCMLVGFEQFDVGSVCIFGWEVVGVLLYRWDVNMVF